ncbi:MAG: gluconokinase [Gemmobacter sp.]
MCFMSMAASLPRSDVPPRFPSRIVVMGVAGCGKSTVGAALAARLGGHYLDGDDLHPSANVEKMRRGQPLTDTDRRPWLDLVGAALARMDPPALIGCSALRRAYRDRITVAAGGPVFFLHLAGSRDLIGARMAARTGHYMPTSLLDSQFATLEPPAPDEWAAEIDIGLPADAVVAAALAALPHP